MQFQSLILSNLTNQIPSTQFDISDRDYIQNMQLADLTFNKPGKIGIVIGADRFLSVSYPSETNGPDGFPLAYNTIFGWILSGESPCELDRRRKII